MSVTERFWVASVASAVGFVAMALLVLVVRLTDIYDRKTEGFLLLLPAALLVMTVAFYVAHLTIRALRRKDAEP